MPAIIAHIRDAHLDTERRFTIDDDPYGGYLVTAPDGAILAITDDYGDDDDWGFTYSTYADAEALDNREHDDHSGGTTTYEARTFLAGWFAEHDRDAAPEGPAYEAPAEMID